MFKKMAVGLAVLFGALAFMPTHTAHAQSSTFTIAPVYDNAASKQAGYFTFVAKPGTTVNIGANVTNLASEAKSLKVQIADAYTTDGGQVAYDASGPKDDSAKYRLSELSGGAHTVKLAANQTKRVNFALKVPANGFKGELVGSFFTLDSAKYNKSSQGAMTINNRYAMYTPVVLKTNTTYVHPSLKLKKLRLGNQAGKAAVIATVQNVAPSLFGKMSIKAKVYQGNQSKPVLTRNVTGYAMAPNSHFDYALASKHAFAPGKYTLDMVAHSGDRTWHFRRSMTVSRAKANKVNDAASLKLENQTPWWLIALLILMAVVILLLIVILLKRRKHNEDE